MLDGDILDWARRLISHEDRVISAIAVIVVGYALFGILWGRRMRKTLPRAASRVASDRPFG